MLVLKSLIQYYKNDRKDFIWKQRTYNKID